MALCTHARVILNEVFMLGESCFFGFVLHNQLNLFMQTHRHVFYCGLGRVYRANLFGAEDDLLTKKGLIFESQPLRSVFRDTAHRASHNLDLAFAFVLAIVI